jgi:hypothetical protein
LLPHIGGIKRMPTKNGPGDRPRRAIPWSQVRFALDSPLEGGGFEPSVPRKRDSVFRCAPDRAPREILPAARLARRQSVLWSNHILSVKIRRLRPTRILSAYKKKEVPGPLTPAKAAGNQIPVVNRVFTPSAADIAFAERVVGVFARAVGEGSAAIQVDGKLIGRHP